MFSYNAPIYFWNKVIPFNFSIFFQPFCIICVLFMGKEFGVVAESFFERLLCNSNKIAIKQLQVKVALGMNTLKRIR